ncbi:hypothetical protein HOY80DRAFT_219831 [Tuber brumale]|nr:hypothetical protein HOY80DRAFT_219831 [Tuber brumale]
MACRGLKGLGELRKRRDEKLRKGGQSGNENSMRVEDSWSEMRDKMDFVGRRARKGREKRETPRAFEGVFIHSTRGAGVGQMAIIVVSNLPSTIASSHQVSPTPQPYPPTSPHAAAKREAKDRKQTILQREKEKEIIDNLPYCFIHPPIHPPHPSIDPSIPPRLLACLLMPPLCMLEFHDLRIHQPCLSSPPPPKRKKKGKREKKHHKNSRYVSTLG